MYCFFILFNLDLIQLNYSIMKAIYTLLILFVPFCSFSQLKFYGDSLSQFGNDIINTDDGNILVAGFNVSGFSSLENRDGLLLKLSYSGDILWQKSIGGSNLDEFTSVIDDNGYYYMCGKTSSFSDDTISDVYVVKTDYDGNVIWSKVFGGNGCAGPYCGDVANKIIKYGDNFIISGYASSSVNGLIDAYLIEINSNGELIESEIIDSGNGSQYYNSVTLSSDGGLILAGVNKVVSFEPWLRKLDINGNLIFSNAYGDASQIGNGAVDLVEKNDTTFLLVTNQDGTDGLLKIDQLGDTIFCKSFTGVGALDIIFSIDSNSIFIIGQKFENIDYVMNVDLNGDFLDIRFFENLNIKKLIQNNNGDFFILSNPNINTNGMSDISVFHNYFFNENYCTDYFDDINFGDFVIQIGGLNDFSSFLSQNSLIESESNDLTPNRCDGCFDYLVQFNFEINSQSVQFVNTSLSNTVDGFSDANFSWQINGIPVSNEFDFLNEFIELGSYEVCLNIYDNCSSISYCDTISINQVFGCTDSIACNFNFNAQVNDGSCQYPSTGLNCDGICVNTSDSLFNICDINNDAEYFVNELSCDGITTFNHSFLGDSSQIGLFNSGNSNIGIENGIIISTGDINGVTAGSFGGFLNNNVNDVDLLEVANSVPQLIDQDFQVTSINDVAILEFDFISDSSFVNLNFVFASSEYFGYENTAFNDAFGIFVSGPGISGEYSNESINIAEIESVEANSLGESLPITISTINEFYNSPLFVNNQNDGINPVYINADGYTTTISANLNVIAGEDYHIKLAIGDASDAALNSYVFFGFGEFCSTNDVYGCTDITALNYDSTATVDNNTCEYFVDCNFDFTFEFEIGNAGCYGANDGFIIIDTLSIEGGTPHYELVFTDLNNEAVDPLNLQSGEYFLTITDDNGCQQSIFYFIEEEQPLSVNAEYSTQLTCDISEFSDILLGFIYTYPSGGNGPYTFDWFNNDDIILDPFYFNGDESSIDYIDAGQYTVVISDSLGCYVSETFEIADIELVEYNGYSTTQPTNCGEEACNGSITVYSYNASNESLYLYNSQGIQLNANPVYTDSTITMYGLCEGEYYYVLQNNQSFCQLNSLNFTDIILTNESNCNECDFSFGQINSDNPYCYGSSDGQIYSTTPLQFGTQPYEVTLMNGNFIQSTYVTDNPQFYFGQLTSGFSYQVIITDSLGCTINEYFNLTEPEPIQLIQNNFNSNNESCFPGNDGQIGFQVVGGTPEYNITAFEENILFNGQNYSIQNLSSDWYSIFVMDANDCIADTIFYVDQTDLSVNLTTYDIYCSNALTDNDDLVVVDEGLVEVSLSPSLNLENVIVEITNLATQETVGTELDSVEVYTQNLVAGNYQLLAFLPNTNCFYSEEFIIVDYSLDVVISTAPSSSVFASDGSLSLNFLTSLFPYNVVITGPNNYFYETSTQNSQLDVFELSSGDYFISITDNENCVEEFEIFLNFVPMLIGCTDSTAINYNPNAEADDGSCDYCSLNLVSIENTTCQNESGYIEVSSNSPYEYQLQILVDNEWVFYNDGGCFEFLNNGYGASWECLPADTFMIIGFGLNDCIDTLNSSIVNLTELIESEQLPMTQTPQLSDDVYSDVISIGFDFEFNGVEYNECLISSNNYLSFNTANANSYSPWNISNAIPSNISPLNTIMTPYQDLNPFLGGSIYYTTYGTAPNRVFIVRWKEVPMYSCSDELFSSTLYLYEGSNNIESHIEYKPICTEWNEGAAIHGIHNSDGTQADVVFDIFTNQFRNYPLLWTAVNDAFLFSPLDNGNGYVISTLEYGSQYNTDEYLTTTIAEEFGCTDPLALNYNQAAICDDNSCEYPIVFGCTDELAFNFNEDAEINDGSCCYQNPTTIVVNTGDDLSQTSWSLSDLEENELFSFGLSNYPENTDSARTDFFCLADGCYQINMNNWNGGSIEIYSFDEEILNVEPAIGSDVTIIQFCLPIDLIGCMDSLACNFNPYANEDDGSCAYPQEVNQEFTFCDGFELDGVFYNQSFMSTDTLISTSGCDSIVNNMYIINYSPEIEMFVDFFNNSLTAQTFNDDNSYQYSWNTGENTQTIGTDTNGIYSVTVTDSISLCSSTSSINVSWLDVSSINGDSEFVNDFKIYPNPSFDIFNIELNVQNFQEIEIRVVNSIGQQIYLERVEVEGVYREQLDLSNYSKGVYNLTITTADVSTNHRLILQ